MVYNDTVDYSNSVDSLFQVINSSLSTYHSNSIISKINKGDSLVLVDDHFVRVFNKAKRIHKETNSYFDPTVGVLVNAWGFGPEKPEKTPDSSAVKKMMKLVGFEKVILEKNRIVKENPNIYIDFNAIAKGYSVDVIGTFIESKKITDYMVEVGGEVRVRGVNPNGKPWEIGIEKPNTNGLRSNQTTIKISNKAVATSGNYRKFKIDKKGKKYVHTVNPKTGYTEQNDLLSVSVISNKDCADVDAYATAFMAMGYEKTNVFLKKNMYLQAVLIYLDDHGETHIEFVNR